MVRELFTWGSFGFAVAAMLFVCVLTLRRLHLSRRERLRRRMESPVQGVWNLLGCIWVARNPKEHLA